jgi:rubrerythrin
MTTLVGTQNKFEDALYELCELDFDAVEAYEAAINRLKKESFKQKLMEFKKDHERHITEISTLLEEHQIKAPEGPSLKGLLTQGKVIFTNLIDDEAILEAMLTNEEDTNTAYERLNSHLGKWEDASDVLKNGLADEKKHKQWLELILKEAE